MQLYADVLTKDYNFDHKFTLSLLSSTGLVLCDPIFWFYVPYFPKLMFLVTVVVHLFARMIPIIFFFNLKVLACLEDPSQYSGFVLYTLYPNMFFKNILGLHVDILSSEFWSPKPIILNNADSFSLSFFLSMKNVVLIGHSSCCGGSMRKMLLSHFCCLLQEQFLIILPLAYDVVYLTCFHTWLLYCRDLQLQVWRGINFSLVT